MGLEPHRAPLTHDPAHNTHRTTTIERESESERESSTNQGRGGSSVTRRGVCVYVCVL